MKTRIISAIIAALIVIPVVYFGGNFYRIGVGIVAVIGYTEFLMAREKVKKIPDMVKIISYIALFLLFTNHVLNKATFGLDYRFLLMLILLFLIPLIFYHDDSKYNTDDALYLIGGTLFLSLAFGILYYIRELGLTTLIYLLTITIASDTFAYFTGKLIGKHKMISTISPNKTWEGAIGGTIMSVALGSIYFVNFVNTEQSLITAIFITLFLSIISQFGDLVFSALKRHAKIKDFSNIMPGHGGILDRLDSLILIMIAYMLIIL